MAYISVDGVAGWQEARNRVAMCILHMSVARRDHFMFVLLDHYADLGVRSFKKFVIDHQTVRALIRLFDRSGMQTLSKNTRTGKIRTIIIIIIIVLLLLLVFILLQVLSSRCKRHTFFLDHKLLLLKIL